MTFNVGEARDENGRWTAGAVAGLIFNLKALEGDNAAFDGLMGRLRDSKISQPDMLKIASGYLEREFPKATPKTELLRKIAERQIEVAYERVKIIQVMKASQFSK